VRIYFTKTEILVLEDIIRGAAFEQSNGQFFVYRMIGRSGHLARTAALADNPSHSDSARSEMIKSMPPKLGWITVPSFYGEPGNSLTGTSVTHDVDTLLKRLEQEGVQGIVIDLRNNGGWETLNILSDFVSLNRTPLTINAGSP
jgi:Peptidase family S41